jgi:hypothetical protein
MPPYDAAPVSLAAAPEFGPAPAPPGYYGPAAAATATAPEPRPDAEGADSEERILPWPWLRSVDGLRRLRLVGFALSARRLQAIRQALPAAAELVVEAQDRDSSDPLDAGAV